MENIKREIKLFWMKYGKLLLQIIAVTIFFIYALKALNKYSIYINDEERKATLEYREKNKDEKDKNIKNQKQKECIYEFIKYCNENSVEKAYNMLSENCKKEKYKTISEFEKKYIKVIFKERKDYKVQNDKKNIYKITFLQSILQSGSINKRNQIGDYYEIEEDVFENMKIYINLYNNIM